MPRTLLPFLALLPWLSGCSENTMHSIGDGKGSGGPAIEVDPVLLEYGTLEDGQSEVLVFNIYSVGDSDLVVDSIWVEEGVHSFSLLGNTAYEIPTGESVHVQVVFSPAEADENLGTVVVSSNDELIPEVEVDLWGGGLVPELSINPDPYDFGNTYVGCPHEGSLQLVNVGNAQLEISDVVQAGDDFSASLEDALPIILAPGELSVVNMAFSPSAEGPGFNSTLTVTSNEPIGVRTGTQTGRGLYAGDYSDNWELMEDPPSDILFLVDQSCSMDDDAQRLANNFSTFINQLNTYTSSWHISVVNGDDGCSDISGTAYMSSSTSDYQSRFGVAVQVGSDYQSGYGNTERLLTVAAQAIENTDGGECLSGFMRPNAMLHIIMVSDEPEQSYSSWSSYVTQVINKKGTSSLVRMSAIAGANSGGCNASYGSGYYEAVNYTGGEFLDICSSSWTGHMQSLAQASITQDTFELSQTAAETTIEVWVSGYQRMSGWYFDAGLNAVVFTGGIPGGGDTIEIDYSALASCD